jgi:hypothetical protein
MSIIIIDNGKVAYRVDDYRRPMCLICGDVAEY